MSAPARPRHRLVPRWFLKFALVCFVAVWGLGALRDGLDHLQGFPGPASPTEAESARTALGLLAELPVDPETDRNTYEREAFGSGWATQPDGCSTRARVLIEESVTPTRISEGCVVAGGSWDPWYGGTGPVADPSGLDVDHLVPLAEAWVSGANRWNHERRVGFANDLARPDALVAVPASQNRAKSDQDPAGWMPPDTAVWCRYAIGWVTQKHAWGLAVDQAEHDRLADVLQDCTAVGEPEGRG